MCASAELQSGALTAFRAARTQWQAQSPAGNKWWGLTRLCYGKSFGRRRRKDGAWSLWQSAERRILRRTASAGGGRVWALDAWSHGFACLETWGMLDFHQNDHFRSALFPCITLDTHLSGSKVSRMIRYYQLKPSRYETTSRQRSLTWRVVLKTQCWWRGATQSRAKLVWPTTTSDWQQLWHSSAFHSYVFCCGFFALCLCVFSLSVFLFYFYIRKRSRMHFWQFQTMLHFGFSWLLDFFALTDPY